MKAGAAILLAALAPGWLAGQQPKGQVQASQLTGVVEELRDFPREAISGGGVIARLYLPDASKGYYRSTRFDWSGVISSLEYNGHSYFGQWFPRYDPKIHDAIQGPVEEFGAGPANAALGWDEAKPGDAVVKIGVGALKKPEGSAPYSSFTVLDILDNGKWSVRRGVNFVEFTHELKDTNGYAYLYRKTVRLADDQPRLTLEHSLRNTGRKTIETNVYEHDFFMLDNQPTGPDFVVKFPFEAHTPRDLGPMARLEGKELHYLQELQSQPRQQTVQSEITGFGGNAGDFDFRVENRKTGAGVRETSDRPLARINFWSIRTTVCPEGYIALKVEPGQETSWRIAYGFYTFPPDR